MAIKKTQNKYCPSKASMCNILLKMYDEAQIEYSIEIDPKEKQRIYENMTNLKMILDIFQDKNTNDIIYSHIEKFRETLADKNAMI